MDPANAQPSPSRVVHCQDAVQWLVSQPVLKGSSFITSLPDLSELPRFDLAAWRNWFIDCAELIMSRTPEDGVALFFQTDIKKSGEWVDKGYLVSKAAERAGATMLFHKVVCRTAPGSITFGRPAYSHLLAFSRGLKLDLSKATADVLPEAGATTWTRGMGEKACQLACKFVLEQTPTRTIVDPFCGHGSVLAVANSMGLAAVGVEISPKRAKRARNLQALMDGRR